MAMSPAAHNTGQGQIYQNFIAGEWRSSASGKTFSSTNPANTNEVVGHFQQSTLADLEEGSIGQSDREHLEQFSRVAGRERGPALLA